jgi:hypothetical protein
MKRLLSIFLFTVLCLNGFSQPNPNRASKLGYYARVSVGVLTGDLSTVSVLASNGISMGRIDLGLGLGLEGHDFRGYAPIMIESRYHLTNGVTQPFIGIGGGYLAALNNYYNDYRGGYTAGANIGMTHYLTKHIGITTTLGYRFSYTHLYVTNWASVQPSYYSTDPNLVRNMHRVEFRVGMAFR